MHEIQRVGPSSTVGRLRRLLDARPTAVVLVGRALSQLGLLIFIVLSSLTLTDGGFNALIVGITINAMLITAPCAALQMHFVRHDAPNLVGASRTIALLAVACAVPALGLTFLIGGNHSWYPVLAAGTVLTALPVYRTTQLAAESRFSESALLDSIFGLLLAAASAIMLTTENPANWALAYAVASLTYAVLIVFLFRIDRPPTGGERPRLWSSTWAARALILLGIVSLAFNRIDYLVMTLVASDAEATRYALAGRVVGPVLLMLGSLNNSLYVRQIGLAGPELRRLTSRVSRKMGLIALMLVPCIAIGIATIGLLVDGLGSRDLVGPSTLLALATVPFAFVVPYSFAMSARNLERIWLAILAVAVAIDAVAVAVVGSHGAVAVAAVWLAIQICVALTTLRFASRHDLR
jgi:O-antigen/teichoic acid export membrane protein